MRILALEPYFGGSHRVFLDQWQRFSRHEFETWTLPAHHWKWRMRHAPVWFSQRARQAWSAGSRWDAIFCSDMLDLAQFQGLAGPPIAALPAVVYFHENQLTYPVRFPDQRDLHYAFTNFTSAMAADAVWFNSAFHRHEFFDAVTTWLTGMPDFAPLSAVEQAASKACVQSPGIDVVDAREHGESTSNAAPLRIAWAARWEHDKDPDTFFQALRSLERHGVAYRLSVFGESFRDAPECFNEARVEFDRQIDQWGYVADRLEYLRRLGAADVLVSTAHHEFFGLAVMEGIAMGVYPVLPRRLSYPELLDVEHVPEAAAFFYDGEAASLAQHLARLANSRQDLARPELRQVLKNSAARYQWPVRATAMDDAIEQLAFPPGHRHGDSGHRHGDSGHRHGDSGHRQGDPGHRQGDEVQE